MKTASYVYGNGPSMLLGETIGECLDRVASRFPDNDALVAIPQDRRFTYAEFKREVDTLARALMAIDVRRGDRVAIWSVNHFEWVVTQFATAKIGAVLVNVNPAYRTHELAYALEQSRARVMLLAESFKSSKYVAMLREVCPEAFVSAGKRANSSRFPHFEHAIVIEREKSDLQSYEELLALASNVSEEDLAERAGKLDIDDIANIQYTSGTTGTPKGVMLTHHNIVNNAHAIAEAMKLTPGDRLCIPVPFYHCFGMVVSNLTAVTHGATIVIPSPVFDAHAALAAVQAEKCTVLHGVPTMFLAELEHPEFSTFDLSTLRTGIMAGAPCPVELARRVIADMNMREFLIAYGMTESSPVCTITSPDDALERRVGSVGRVMPGQELKIIDPATGATLPRHQPGEICFRGYHVMAGYDHDPRATAEAIDRSAWLHSGDIGIMDDDGYVRISGRIKEMVIRGGENIYPREIEEFLHTLDIVADAYVVGIPDDRLGEELCACIRLREGVPEPTEEQMKERCRDRIAHFKIPRYWLFMEDYPLTVTGKVQKFKLRDMALERLSLLCKTT